MSLRARLVGAVLASAALGAAAATACHLGLAWARWEKDAMARSRQVLDAASKVAQESLLARDPMLLAGYVSHLRRHHPEIAAARMGSGREWTAVGPPAGAPDDGVALASTARVLRSDGSASEMTLELTFSKAALRREARARLAGSARLGFLAALLAGLLALPAAFALGRRVGDRLARLGREIDAVAGEAGPRAPGAAETDEFERLSARVRALGERLKEADRMKRDFVSSVTHELRSPLGAIESHARALLADAGADGRTRDYLERILSSAAGLGRLITQLLELSRIERGMFDLSPRRADLAELVRDAVLFYSPRAQEAGLRLSLELPPGELSADMDRERVGQVLGNLISNALKFSPPGGTVTVYAKEGDGGRCVEAGVVDSGPGLEPEDIQRLFQPFSAVRGPRNRSGAGLGLAVAKAIVAMHNGTIDVDSAPGRGSRFYFRLPIRMAVPRR